MKKVAILTRRYGENFGSSFQAYALQYTIDRLGFKTKVLDYDEFHHSLRWRIKPLIYDILYFFCKIGIMKFISEKLNTMLVNRHKQQHKFQLFDNKTLHKTSQKLKTKKQLSKVVAAFDCCVCGSDQIWNPFLFDENYYLSFVNKKCTRKIAYAASLGISDELLISNRIKTLISDFDFISVRESDAVEILTKAGINNRIELVLDPTLLVEVSIWKSLQSDYQVDGDYILCYFLGKNIPNNFISALKEKTGLQVVNIQMFYNINSLKADIELFDIGPSDFLSLLSNANYVCTDSYHGMLMSYIYHKDFFVFNRFSDNDLKNPNTRINSILRLMNLEDRKSNNTDYDNIELSVNYSDKTSLSNMIKDSFFFIKKSLQ